MPNLIASTAQQSSYGAVVSLFLLDATAVDGEIFRFTTGPLGGQAVMFDGDIYVPVPVELSGLSWSGQGAIPTPTLKVSNLQGQFVTALLGGDNLVGARLTITKTFESFLDGGTNPDPTMTFPPEVFSVDQLTKMDNEEITWRLAALFDVRGVQLPRRQILRDACTHRYRRFVDGGFDYENVTCPYVGANSYNLQNQPVSASEDRCALNLGACKIRFGQHASLPFRGFPGAARVRDRV